MTCRATRRERVLVSRAVHPPLPRRRSRRTSAAALELDEIPLVADGPAAGTTDLAALERLLADGDARSPASSPAQPNFFGLLEPMAEIGRLAHAAGALFVAVIEPVSLAVLAPPGAYGADIAAGEGQPLGIPPQYGGPYLGHPRLDRRARPPDPGPARRDDDRRRRPAGLRHDAARARAGHPARQGRQQHLHEPGAAARSPRASTSRRSGRTACATSPPWAPRGPRELEAALAAVGAPRVHPGAVPQRVRRPRPGRRAPSIAGCSSAACSPASSLGDAVPDEPALADALLVCATEVTTADEIARFARGPRRRAGRSTIRRRRRGAIDAPARRAFRGGGPMTVVGAQLQPTLFELSRPGRGGGKIPHPPKDALDRIPAERPARDAAGPARAQRARGRPPLRQPVAAELRDRHGLLPARLVHDEVQPQAQRVGGPPARLRDAPPARARRGRPGHAPAPVGARGGARRDQRDARGHAPAGGRRPGRADRDPDDPRLPPGARRHRARRGPRPGLARTGRTRRPRRWPASGRSRSRRPPDGGVDLDAFRAALGPADGGGDDHEPVDARACSSGGSASCSTRSTRPARSPTWTART